MAERTGVSGGTHTTISVEGPETLQVEVIEQPQARGRRYVIKFNFGLPPQTQTRSAVAQPSGPPRARPRPGRLALPFKLHFDRASGVLSQRGLPLQLSRHERDLFALLEAERGAWCSPQALLREIWGVDSVPCLYLLYPLVHGLRAKLNQATAGAGAVIEGRRNLGYRLCDGLACCTPRAPSTRRADGADADPPDRS
jgi:hypothetical protein